jgi:hypothetical protein
LLLSWFWDDYKNTELKKAWGDYRDKDRVW